MLLISTLILFISACLGTSNSYKDYDNDFVDPSYILAKKFDPSTAGAQQSIVEWADFLAAQGPWCEYSTTWDACFVLGELTEHRLKAVMNKTVTAPTGNKHDYLSWAP